MLKQRIGTELLASQIIKEPLAKLVASALLALRE